MAEKTGFSEGGRFQLGRMGRPLKYGSHPVRAISLALPTNVIDYLQSEGERRNKSRNEVAIALLVSADQRLATRFIEQQDEMREMIRGLTNSNTELIRKMEQSFGTLGLFVKIEGEDELDLILEEHKEELEKRIKAKIEKKDYQTDNMRTAFADYLLGKLKAKAAEQGLYLRREPFTRKLLEERVGIFICDRINPERQVVMAQANPIIAEVAH